MAPTFSNSLYPQHKATVRTSVLILAMATTFLGCTQENVPTPIAPGAKFEIFATTTADNPTAKKAIDPASGSPLFLKTPPILTTQDVATVAQSEAEIKMADDKPSGHRQLRITVKLTELGGKKMATATANPNGDQVAVAVNGKVIAAPKVFSQIQGSFEISGDNALVIFAFEALTNRGATPTEGRTKR